MIIIQLMGGLGNQLQQYALYKKLLSMGKEVRIDDSWFGEEHLTNRRIELSYLNGITYRVCSEEEKNKLIGSDGMGGKLRRKLLPKTVSRFQESKTFHPEILEFEDMYLSGYFACEKYYADILPLLREEIDCGNPGSENEEWIKKMNSTNSVSIHFRRGDYLNPENKEVFGGICTDAYYESAIALAKKYLGQEKPVFYVFSDDLTYAKEWFDQRKDFVYSVVDCNHGEKNYLDMFLMSKCRVQICANSTFSFWGARFNKQENKCMIRPTIQKNSQIFEEEEMRELWKGWNFIDPEGKTYSCVE